MSEKFNHLFTFLIGQPFDDVIYIWLLKRSDEQKDIDNWKRMWYSSEYDRLIDVSLDKPYTDPNRMFTLDEFNEKFMGKNKITKIPDSIVKKREINKEHMSINTTKKLVNY